MSEEKQCAIPGCGKKATDIGMCRGHESRWRRGDRGTRLTRPFRIHNEIPGGVQDAIKISVNQEQPAQSLSDSLYKLLLSSKASWTIESLSDKFNVGVTRVRDALKILADEGKNVSISDSIQIERALPTATESAVIDVSKLKGKRHIYGVTGDNHLASRYAREEVLSALFDIWVDQGVEIVYQCGNMIDGEFAFNKFDLVTNAGFEAQVDYFVERWPQRKGIVTKFVTGDDHEGWYIRREGINVGRILEQRAIEAGRNDLVFLGHMEHNIVLQGKKTSSTLRVIHAGGGSAYATSYTSLKYAESLQGGMKPAMVLVGHFHKFCYDYPREINIVQVGSTQDQTPWMRKKRIKSHIGGCTVSFNVSDDGLMNAIAVEWHPFFDKMFYEGKEWKYQWKSEEGET